MDSTYKQAQLYNAAKTWFVNTFKSAKDVIQSEDAMNGRFLAKGNTVVSGVNSLNSPISPNISFYIQIDLKDAKYRVRVYNFISLIDFMNTHNEIPVDKEYELYLTNKNPKGWAMSRDKFNKRADKAFTNFDTTIIGLMTSLNNAILTNKKDDF